MSSIITAATQFIAITKNVSFITSIHSFKRPSDKRTTFVNPNIEVTLE